MNLSILTTTQISVILHWEGMKLREKYPEWQAKKGSESEWGDTAEEAVEKLIKTLNLGQT